MQEYNTDMARLAQNAADAGVSQQLLTQQMKELNFVTGETDSNVEALSNLMAAGFKENTLADTVTALSGAVVKFPDTMKIESLADSLQETIATGQATGQFAELLGRVGIEADKFNKNLQQQIKLGNEQQFVLNTLSKAGLPQVAEQYKIANKGQREYADAQFELKESMAVIAKEAAPIMTSMIEKLNELMVKHAKEIQSVIGLIGTIAEIVLQVIAALSMVPAPVWVIIAGIVTIITAVNMVSKAVGGAKSAFSLFTGTLSPASYQIMSFISIGLALSSVLALLAGLWLMIRDGAGRALEAMKQMNEIQIKPPEIPFPNPPRAYAKGTLTAANGWALVGEEGPELVAFGGGERVFNNRETTSLLEGHNGGGLEGMRIETLNIYPDNRQWAELMELLKQARQARQQRRKQ